MNIDASRTPLIEGAFRTLRGVLDDEMAKVLFDYTLLVHQAWRPLLAALQVAEGSRALDVGTGFGFVPIELACHAPITVEGIDIDPKYVALATNLRDAFERQGFIAAGSHVSFATGDVHDLPCEDSTFDLVLVREVFQFLQEPARAASELARVTKTGGTCWVSDIDDQLFVSYPDPSDAFKKLHTAIAAVQVASGGDRYIGRKLSSLLGGAGMEIRSVFAIPEARHWLETPDDLERGCVMDQLREARKRVVDAGLLGASEFDELIGQLEAEPFLERFRFNARIVVVAQRTW